jgi:DNA polymerase-1
VFTQLHQQFKSKAEQVLNEIREAINWSDFSGKGYHRTEFVYGYRPGMKQSRVSPETARLLCFPPLIDPEQHQQQYTDSIPISSDNIDYPEEIEDYRDEEEILTFLATKTKTPYPTNQLALSLLMQKYAGNPQYYRKIELLNKFRHFCLLTSMLERVLSIKPTTGLLKYKRVDEKGNIYLHPTFLNILKTGRTCIIRPNLQNLSKKREEDYSTIFGDDYKHPVRSIVQSRPGYCLVEMDLVAAELVILAIVSGDEHLYSLCMRSMLPKDNPDYLDIHSYIALKILRRDDIKPTKDELESHGLIHYRTLAKTAIYGLVYGQTAENFFIVSRVNGLPLKSIKEAEEFIYKLEEQFPKLIRFIKNIVPRFIYQNFYSYNCFGRLRRFSKISENTFGDRALFKKLMGKNIREGVNFIPQSIVADIISLTAASIQNIKQLYNLDFRLVLQLHDALLYEVKDEDVEKFIPVVENIVKNIKIKANYMENGIGYGALKPEIKIYPNNWGLD